MLENLRYNGKVKSDSITIVLQIRGIYMKKLTKVLCCLLALVAAISCFAACGDKGDETTVPTNIGNDVEIGRDSVKDDVPTNLNFGGDDVTFFVRDNLELWKNEMDVEKTTNDTLYDAIYNC